MLLTWPSTASMGLNENTAARALPASCRLHNSRERDTIANSTYQSKLPRIELGECFTLVHLLHNLPVIIQVYWMLITNISRATI
jgi:hypothetical protein